MGRDIDRNDWELRYEIGDYVPRQEPSKLLENFVEWVPDGRAMEVAAGTGRNAIFLAKRGYNVDALDISSKALKIGEEEAKECSVDVNWIQADADNHKFPTNQYSIIIVSFYHNPNIIPNLIKSLEPGGVLLYEHHVKTPNAVDRGPSDTHRYNQNELLRACRDQEIYYYEETVRTYESGDRAGQTAAVASIVSRKPGSELLNHPPAFQ